MKKIIRQILRPLLYLFYYLPFQKKIDVSCDGEPLKKGVTAVISMKNEEYTIESCIKSLVNIADQIICIDNGSTDKTIERARKAISDLKNSNVEIELVEMPNALLGDCRNEGLKRTKYQWHLRWDADMIAQTDGPNDIKKMRDLIMKTKAPHSFQLPRTNLYGDLYHTSKTGKIIDDGEPFLIYFNKHIKYVEYGKFDTIKVPLYYKQVKIEDSFIFHLGGLKSEENLMHRFHYFTWRKYLNSTIPGQPSFDLSYEDFRSRREEYLFSSDNKNTIKYRYQRQRVTHLIKFDENKYGPYPLLVKEMLANNRFLVEYKDGVPFQRKDNEDVDMLNYHPSEEDDSWDVNQFFKKLEKENISLYSK